MISVRNIIVAAIVGTFALIVIVSVATHGFAVQKQQPITSNLPIVVLRMDSTLPVDVDTAEEYITAWMDVIDSGGDSNTFHMPYDLNSVTERYKIGVHIRGQTTRRDPKKPFAVKMYDYESTELKKKDYALFGMPKQDKYVLYSICSDPALIRNQVCFQLHRNMGNFSPRMEYIELFIAPTNSTEVYYPQHYHGVYMMSERIHRGDDWVDVKKMDEDDNAGKAVTGGYIFRVDKWKDGEEDPNSIFSTEYTNYIITEPSDEVLTTEKVNYLHDYVSRVERAIMTANTSSPSENYTDLIDSVSFADTFIIQEFGKNVDAYRLSSYYHKDRNGKMKSGPMWDLDRTFGNQLFGLDEISGFIVNSQDAVVDLEAIPAYWPALVADPKFRLVLKNRWTELRAGPLSTPNVTKLINGYRDQLEEKDAAYRDYNRWGPWYFPFEFWVTESYSQHQTGIVREWALERLKWMDGAIAKF